MRKGWDDSRKRYVCADQKLAISVRADTIKLDEDYIPSRAWTPLNGLCYRPSEKLLLAVASAQAVSRDFREIVAGAPDVRTVVFPHTVRKTSDSAFQNRKRLLSAVVNEGVEVLPGIMKFNHWGDIERFGVFKASGLVHVRLPSTLKSLGACAFYGCSRLTKVELPDGLKDMEDDCFQASGVTKLVIPRSFTDFIPGVFDAEPITIAFPDGTETIRRRSWFESPLVERVVVPASVQRIAAYAFRGMWQLQAVEFAPGSALRSIGAGAFQNSGLTEFAAPPSLQRIGSMAFSGCD